MEQLDGSEPDEVLLTGHQVEAESLDEKLSDEAPEPPAVARLARRTRRAISSDRAAAERAIARVRVRTNVMAA